MLSVPALAEIAQCNHVRADRFHPHLVRTMERRGIGTPLRVAHFLAQVLHESGRLAFTSELWGPTPAQQRYERSFHHRWPPRSKSERNTLAFTLGNEEPGDGYRFRGRGLIQLTGRSNYEQYSAAVGIDFTRDPALLSEVPWCVDVAGWYWQTRDLNRWADRDDLRQVTRRVNGGFNGFADRERLLLRAKNVLWAESLLVEGGCVADGSISNVVPLPPALPPQPTPRRHL